jgi:flagellar hook-associated protein 3 FlgL
MRITNNMKINMSLNNVASHNERLNDLQQQIASGKKILRPSDDPLGAATSIKMTVKKSSIEYYNNNLVYAKNNLSDTDGAFGSVSNVLNRVKELAVRGSNGTLNQGDRDVIANEMQTLLEQIISDANLKTASGYAFSGSAINRMPFSVMIGAGRNFSIGTNADSVSNINNVVYNGDKADLLMNESQNSKIVSNVNGETAFMNVTGQSVYSAKTFADINKAPAADNLKAGYFTIKGRGYEEIVKMDGNESLQAVADKINRGSQIASAKIVEDAGGYRLLLEARVKGAANQFSLIEGATGMPRTKTNFLEIAGLNSKMQSVEDIADTDGKIAFQPELSGVRNGYFYLNGRMVTVDVNKDSMKDIAKKINETVKNVYAKIEDGRLTLEGAGSLTIESDSSGLMNKLAMPRSRFISEKMLSDSVVGAAPLAENEWVKNGNFYINGRNIGIIDASSETLSDVAVRINATAGLNASATMENGRFVIKSTNGQPLNIADGTSEFIKSFKFSLSGDGLAMSSDETLTSPMLAGNIGSIGVNDGILTVNGVGVEYKASDTLSGVARKISQSVAGVNAYVNSNNQIVFDSAAGVELSDSSNFLEKMSIKEEKIVDNNNRVGIQRLSENGQSIFDILIEIRDQLLNGDIEGLANNLKAGGSGIGADINKSGLAKLDEAISHIADMREITGSALSRVDRSTARNKEIEVYINKILTETEGIDFEKAVVELNTVDLIYRSALQISARINQQSLLDFLK